MISYRQADLIDTLKDKQRKQSGIIRITKMHDPWDDIFWSLKKPRPADVDTDVYNLIIETLKECGFTERDADIQGFSLHMGSIRFDDEVYNKILDTMPKHGLLPIESSLSPTEEPYIIEIKYRAMYL